jgi:hypothetical protein
MPRLPDYTDLGRAPTPRPAGGIASYQPADNSGMARGLQEAGREIAQASQILAETNARQDVVVAEAALNRLQQQRLDLEAGEQGFSRVRGSGVVSPKFVADYEQRFKAAARDIEQSLANDNQRRLFQQRVPTTGLQFRSALLRHQATETDRFNDLTENETVDSARRQIFDSPLDPQALDAGLARMNWAIDQKAQRMGWDSTVTQETKATFRQKVMEDLGAILVERDPAGALQALNVRMGIGVEPGPSGVTAFDAVGPEKLVTLRNRAASYVEQSRARLEAEQKKRLKEAEDEVKALREFALTGQMVSPAYEQQVLAKTIGTPYEAGARALVQSSYVGATHGAQTLTTQEQRLAQMDTQLALQGGSPEELKLVQSAREITNRQRAAYKENPWAAATRFGRQPAVPEVTLTAPEQVPQLVGQRLTLINGVETYAGAPVSPLQPNEAKAFTAMLQGMPPEQRAEVIAQTGAQLTVPRGAALAEQIDAHDKPLALSLKMGLDRTTAGRAASVYVLRGAQALKDKTVAKDDSALAGWRAEIATHVRGALGNDAAEQDVIDAAYYVRAALEQEGIAPSGLKPMSANAENAIAMVIGRPVTRAGVKTFLPRGMDESTFDDRLQAYTAERLHAMTFTRSEGTDVQRTPIGVFFVRGAPITAAQLAARLPEYGLKRDGAGRYVPVVRNAPITLDPQGQQLLRLEIAP